MYLGFLGYDGKGSPFLTRTLRQRLDKDREQVYGSEKQSSISEKVAGHPQQKK
jgi:hypothetical protein